MFIIKIENLNQLRNALNLMQDYVLKYTAQEDILYNSKLIACELISNALNHGKCEAVLEVECLANNLQICVSGDEFKICKDAVIPDANSQSGRGLFLIDALCDELEKVGTTTRVKIKI